MVWKITPSFTQWTPALISTALWLDAADASTVTTVSGAVSQWNDKSGNGRNATQGTANSRPTYTNAGLNGRNILTLDGGDNLFGSAQIASPGFGMIVVCSFANNTSRMAVLDISNGASSYCVIEQNTFLSPTQSYGFYASSAACYSTVGTTAGPKIIFAASSANSGSSVAATTTYAVNGLASGLTRAGGASNYGSIGIGYTVGSFQGNIAIMTGTVAEIIAFSSFVSETIQQKLEGYLAHKWGLTANLPAGHPHKVNPPAP